MILSVDLRHDDQVTANPNQGASGAMWIGIRDACSAARLLARRLGGGPLSPIRYGVKVVSSPHMRLGHAAVIGVVPERRGARAAAAVATLMTSLRHANSMPVTSKNLPLGLRLARRQWRVVNLAASDSQREPGAALRLGRAVLELADHHHAVLWAEARLDDLRLLPAYMDHGFVPSNESPGPRGTKLRREPSPRSSAEIEEDLRRATRLHYEAFPFVEGGEHRVRHWMGRVKDLLPPSVEGHRILEVGCGSGDLAIGLQASGAHVVALDLTASASQRLRQRDPHLAVLQADALALPFGDSSFDDAVSVGVLHHTPDWRRGLAEMARSVRTGGRVIVMVYAPRTPYQLVWTLSGPLRSRVPVTRLEDLPRWFLAVARAVVAAQVGQWLDDSQLRRLIADEFWTPVVSFVSRRELDAAAASLGLLPVRRVRLFFHAHLAAYERIDPP